MNIKVTTIKEDILMLDMEQWAGFEGRIWREEVNVRDFIQKNYKPYDGDESFLAEPTDATNKLWGALQKLQKEEREKVAFLTVKQKLYQDLLHMDLDILMNQ